MGIPSIEEAIMLFVIGSVSILFIVLFVAWCKKKR